MDKILEKIMNFINENTMLLIIICIFLIIILVIYLIDNTIKSKKLEQEELEKKNTPEPTPIENTIPEAAPAIEPAPVVEEPKVEEVPVVEPVVTVPVTEPTPVVEEPKVEEVEVPEVNSNIDELLNKDYSANNKIVDTIDVKPIMEPVVETTKVEEPSKKYSNDKKLSDIFGKKETKPVRSIETTQDFSDELDRILQKLNGEETNSSSLEDTTDYTNMF